MLPRVCRKLTLVENRGRRMLSKWLPCWLKTKGCSLALGMDLLPKHGRAEGESVEGALRQLQRTRMHY